MDKLFVLDSCSFVSVFIVEFKGAFNSGLRTEIRQPYTEIFDIFWGLTEFRSKFWTDEKLKSMWAKNFIF
jgi:hypothetical protein